MYKILIFLFLFIFGIAFGAYGRFSLVNGQLQKIAQEAKNSFIAPAATNTITSGGSGGGGSCGG